MGNFRKLKKNLPPFFSSTQLLSGIRYPTWPLNLYVYKNLKHFLSNNLIEHPKSVENFVKEHLLKALNYHFDTKLTSKQKSISLVKYSLINFFLHILFFTLFEINPFFLVGNLFRSSNLRLFECSTVKKCRKRNIYFIS